MTRYLGGDQDDGAQAVLDRASVGAARQHRPCERGATTTTLHQAAKTGLVTETVLVAVIGPPGAGKSTVVRALAAEIGVPVFRLREAVRARPELLVGLTPGRDPLGWVGQEAVRRLLRATFLDDRLGAGCPAVLLDNFPGTADQLALLADIGESTHAGVALLELCVDMGTAVKRIGQRRVCPVCGPDPHAPAVAAADDPERCGSCLALLARRDTDRPRLQARRMARYIANRPEITDGAAERAIPHLVVNADDPVPEVCRAARHAVSRLIVSPESSRS